MFQISPMWLRIFLSFLVSLIVAFSMTPSVRNFAKRVGAMDVPKDERRVHDHPIPRMGGLAIVISFVVGLVMFVSFTEKVMGVLLGGLIIAVMGAVDDIVDLKPSTKLLVQILAAFVAVRCGVVFNTISNPNFLSLKDTVSIGWLSIPVTIVWIVGCTNAINLIDGLDGLAVGVSAISSFSMMIVSLFVADPTTTFMLACLCGACVGFMPYNLNPASIFMGDVGSQFLGFVLACASIIGTMKVHTIIAFLVPILAMAIPLADTAFAFVRRAVHGQSPFHADKGHFHHRLLAAGLDQKQAVAVLYSLSAAMGLMGVFLAGSGTLMRIVCIIVAFLIIMCVWLFVLKKGKKKSRQDPQEPPCPGVKTCPSGDIQEAGFKHDSEVSEK